MKVFAKHSKHRFCNLFVAALVFAFLSASARAQVLFDNGPADPGTGNYGGAAGYFADSATGDSVGNIFTPNQSGTARSINFAGLYYDYSGTTALTQTTDSFVISLYSVISGITTDSLGSLISQSTLSNVTSSIFAISGPTGVDPEVYVNFPMYQFSGNLTTPFNLSAGTDYFLAISDTTSPTRYFCVDLTATPGPATDCWELISSGGTFHEPDDSLAFSLSSNAVPEPVTYTLLGVGVGLLAFLSRYAHARPIAIPTPTQRAG